PGRVAARARLPSARPRPVGASQGRRWGQVLHPRDQGCVMAQPAVAPIPAHELLLFLLQLAILLGVAIGLGRLAAWAKLPALVGELGAGLLLGPSIFGHLAPGLSAWLLPHDAAQFHLVDAVGQLGVLLLVGLTALHLDVASLRTR